MKNTVDENGDGTQGPLWAGVEFHGAVFRDSVSYRVMAAGSLRIRRRRPSADQHRRGRCRRSIRRRRSRRGEFMQIAAARARRDAAELRLRTGRLAVQDGPRGHDHQRRLELGRLSEDARRSTRRSRCCPSFGDRPADADDVCAEGVFAQRRTRRRRWPSRRWRLCDTWSATKCSSGSSTKLRMLPARQSIQKNPLFATDPTLQASLAQLKNGRLMPTATELRAVWDAHEAALPGAVERRDDAAKRRRRRCSATRSKYRSRCTANIAPDDRRP